MYRKALIVVAMSFALVALSAQSSLAKTVVVGDVSCNPGPTHYATIQAAIDAVTDGSTVLVCPGLYPEQVTIAKAVTVKGISNGNLGAAVITVPAGGLVVNATSVNLGQVAAQLLIQNTTGQPVSVRNIIIDGAGGTCPALANRTIGVLLSNVGGGDPTWGVTAGYLQNDVVRNESNGCNTGEAIVSENSYVTIGPNEIHGFDLDAVIEFGGTANITGNAIQSGLQAVSLNGALHTSVQNNTISTARGIDLDAVSTDVTITGNTIGPFVGTGILLEGSSGNTIKNNRIDASFAGIWVYNASANMVQGNTIFNASQALVLQKSQGGNCYSSNTVNESNIGLLLIQNGAAVDVVSPNTFYNVTNLTVVQ
jgi:parallel beta-helix repeat protein